MTIRKSILCIAALMFVFSTFAAGAAESKVKVLLYHDVSSKIMNANVTTALPLDVFKEHMYKLLNEGYTSVTVTKMFEMMKNGTLPEKAVAITFDDGYLDIYEEVFPFLQEIGYIATTYVIGEKIGTEKNLSGAMLKEMYDSGWEIGSHSMSHRDLISADDLTYEICFSKQIISESSGIPAADVASFAYPYGSADERVMTKVYKCGFLNGGGLGNMFITPEINPYYFARYSVYSHITSEEFAEILRR